MTLVVTIASSDEEASQDQTFWAKVDEFKGNKWFLGFEKKLFLSRDLLNIFLDELKKICLSLSKPTFQTSRFQMYSFGTARGFLFSLPIL